MTVALAEIKELIKSPRLLQGRIAAYLYLGSLIAIQ